MKRIVPWAIVAVAAAGVGLTVAAWKLLVPDRDHYEEPAYTVESSHDGFEVRKYAPTLQAQVTMAGTREQATRQGFSVLAGYIFGGNQSKQSIAMTTPVSATPPSEQIAMTTPVSARQSDAGWTVAFTMPRKWTLDTLPVPSDARVQLVEVPGHRAAVRTFTGRAGASRVEQEEQALVTAVQSAGSTPAGTATLAQFDPPWVLGPWRRNELQMGLVE